MDGSARARGDRRHFSRLLDVKRAFSSREAMPELGQLQIQRRAGPARRFSAPWRCGGASRRWNRKTEAPWLGLFATALFAILLVDLLAYRSIGALRASEAGKVGSSWMEAWGVTALFSPRPGRQLHSASTWHAVLLAVLLSALALVAIPRRFEGLIRKGGMGGTLLSSLLPCPSLFVHAAQRP